MPDVSRAEYDAALKRVREAIEHPDAYTKRIMNWPKGFGRMVEPESAWQARAALLALGLDEPPTEPKPFDVRDHPMAFPSHHDKRWVPSDDSPVPSDRSPTGRKDEPPTEATERMSDDRTPADVIAQTLWDFDYSYPAWGHADEEQRATYLFRAEVVRNLAVVPPAEPPKACPTCGGQRVWIERGGYSPQTVGMESVAGRRHECPDCNGSGIDGGRREGER